MASTFTWLDYSEHERRRALDVIDLFRDPGTLDELGIGAIRDSLADQLFPGTSTIQTRARYFLFVPWIYGSLEERRVSSLDVARRARNEEILLINALADSGERRGVIGIQARRTLKRLPSNVYWFGLCTWGVRLFSGSQDQYHRSLDRFYARRRPELRTDDGEPTASAGLPNWDPHLPPRPAGFPEGETLRLTKPEAEYLQHRVLTHAPGTFLAFLVQTPKTSRASFAWEHELAGQAPDRVTELLEHARRFSTVMQGAALLYNLLLSEAQIHTERIEQYRAALDVWQSAEDHAETVATWDRTRFWSLAGIGAARISPLTRTYVDAWLKLTESRQPPTSDAARRLVRERELLVKRGRARLANPRALDLWNGASGTAQLDFRWPLARDIVNDIIQGLRANA